MNTNTATSHANSHLHATDATASECPADRALPLLALVIPCYNECDSLARTANVLDAVITNLVNTARISASSFMFFVDDGSRDSSWTILAQLHQENGRIRALKLSRNFGHQAALLAGLMEVRTECDVSISIDADLQQDPAAMATFIDEYLAGADIVLGIRKDRGADSFMKKASALGFYRLMNALGVQTIPNHADYRLLSKRALNALALFPEPNIFLRATCLQLGYRTAHVFFDVTERQFGTSKYSVRKMLRLAVHGVTSFSVVPLRLVAMIGLLLFLGTLAMGGYVLWQALVVGDTVPGWASTTLPIYFIGGIQLLCLAIVGEYVGQIYSTVKHRPRWIAAEKI